MAFTVSPNDIRYARTFGLHQRLRGHNLRTPSKLFVFPGLYNNNYLQATRSLEMGNIAEGQLSYQANRRLKVINPLQTQQVDIADNPSAMALAVAGLAQGLSNDSQVSYDLSHIGDNRSSLIVAMYGDAVDWSIQGPLAGTFPDLVLPQDVEAELSEKNISSMYITSFGYKQPGGVTALRQQLASESRADTKIRPEFFDDYDAETIIIDLNQ